MREKEREWYPPPFNLSSARTFTQQSRLCTTRQRLNFWPSGRKITEFSDRSILSEIDLWSLIYLTMRIHCFPRCFLGGVYWIYFCPPAALSFLPIIRPLLSPLHQHSNLISIIYHPLSSLHTNRSKHNSIESSPFSSIEIWREARDRKKRLFVQCHRGNGR